MTRKRISLTGAGIDSDTLPDPADARNTKIDLLAEGPTGTPAPTTGPPAPAAAEQEVSWKPASAPAVSPGAPPPGTAGPGDYRTYHVVHRGWQTTVHLARHAHRSDRWFALK